MHMTRRAASMSCVCAFVAWPMQGAMWCMGPHGAPVRACVHPPSASRPQVWRPCACMHSPALPLGSHEPSHFAPAAPLLRCACGSSASLCPLSSRRHAVHRRTVLRAYWGEASCAHRAAPSAQPCCSNLCCGPTGGPLPGASLCPRGTRDSAWPAAPLAKGEGAQEDRRTGRDPRPAAGAVVPPHARPPLGHAADGPAPPKPCKGSADEGRRVASRCWPLMPLPLHAPSPPPSSRPLGLAPVLG